MENLVPLNLWDVGFKKKIWFEYDYSGDSIASTQFWGKKTWKLGWNTPNSANVLVMDEEEALKKLVNFSQ